MNHKARQLILHFGLPKTGTSALQQTLFDHRDDLLKYHDTLYPGQYESHYYFHALFSEHPESIFRIQMLGFENREAVAAFLENYRQEILTEIEQTKPGQILLSSEYIRELNRNELKAMSAFLETIAEKIILIAYVRDPWGWAVSSLQEQIMTGYTRKEGRFKYTFLLPKMIEKFEDAFGVRPVIAPYVKESKDFNVVVDFCRRFDFTSLEPAAQVNTNVRSGMKREAACVMLELNQYYPVFDENNNYIHDPVRDLMRTTIRHSPFSKTHLQISRKTAEEIYENSRSHIQLLEEQFFGGEKPFTECYNRLQVTDFDDKLSIALLTQEQVSQYLLASMYTLAERVLAEQKTLRELQEEKSGLERDLSAMKVLVDELREIKGSTAWKTVVSFRELRARVAPAGSRRDRFLHWLTESIFNRFDNPKQKFN